MIVKNRGAAYIVWLGSITGVTGVLEESQPIRANATINNGWSETKEIIQLLEML